MSVGYFNGILNLFIIILNLVDIILVLIIFYQWDIVVQKLGWLESVVWDNTNSGVTYYFHTYLRDFQFAFWMDGQDIVGLIVI